MIPPRVVSTRAEFEAFYGPALAPAERALAASATARGMAEARASAVLTGDPDAMWALHLSDGDVAGGYVQGPDGRRVSEAAVELVLSALARRVADGGAALMETAGAQSRMSAWAYRVVAGSPGWTAETLTGRCEGGPHGPSTEVRLDVAGPPRTGGPWLRHAEEAVRAGLASWAPNGRSLIWHNQGSLGASAHARPAGAPPRPPPPSDEDLALEGTVP